jgi:hypothetical protein
MGRVWSAASRDQVVAFGLASALTVAVDATAGAGMVLAPAA